MNSQLSYEDVSVGMEIPQLVKKPSIVQQVMFQSCFWAWHRIHYDRDYALSVGWPDVVVIGRLQGNFLAQMLAQWVGEQGVLRKLAYQAIQVCTIKDTLTCGGRVTKTYVNESQNCVDCEVWVKNQLGEDMMTGTATLVLPSKQ